LPARAGEGAQGGHVGCRRVCGCWAAASVWRADVAKREREK